jgi:hypothetical protein
MNGCSQLRAHLTQRTPYRMDLNQGLKDFTVLAGTVRYADLGYLLAMHDHDVAEGRTGSLLLTWEPGHNGAVALPWTAIAGTVCHVPNERYLALGVNGEVRRMGGGEQGDEHIPVRAPMRSIRGIARGYACAVGTDRQVYLRQGNGQWNCIDASARWGGGTDEETVTFRSVDGFGANEIYVVGDCGEIWRYDGHRFHPVLSGTESDLYQVRCADDGWVYVCGADGTLLCGRGEHFKRIASGQVRDTLSGLESFDGKMFLATDSALFLLDGKSLRPIDFDGAHPRDCGALSAADGLLWSIGQKDVMAFDGQRWRVLARLR